MPIKIGQLTINEAGEEKIEYLKDRSGKEVKVKDKPRALNWLRTNGFDLPTTDLIESFEFTITR